MSYPTALKATPLIRLAIVAHTPDFAEFAGEVELDESYFGSKRKGKRGRGAAGKVPVFGLLERAGRVKVEVVKDVSAETLLDATIKTVRRGSLVYTDQFKGYNALMLCGYQQLKVHYGSGERETNIISVAVRSTSMGWKGSGATPKNASSNIMASHPNASHSTSKKWSFATITDKRNSSPSWSITSVI